MKSFVPYGRLKLIPYGRLKLMIVVVCSLLSVSILSPKAQTTQYPPYPAGMRLLVGSTGALVRNAPNGTCGTDNHVCTTADAVPPGVYGVVQNDPPVFEPAGWWWIRVVYENGKAGWSSGYPPYLNSLSPPQMAQGFSFRVVGDYNGPTLTQGKCTNDGVQSDATLALQAQPNGTGQTGTMSCLWTTPTVGNHIAVITAINNFGTVPSTEFQFSVTTQVVSSPPTPPANLRIGPTTGTTLLKAPEASAAPIITNKPTAEKPTAKPTK